MSWSYASGVLTQNNEAGKSITAVASGGSGWLDLSITAHGYAVNDLVAVTGTTDYNGEYLVFSVPDANTIRISSYTIDYHFDLGSGAYNAFGVTRTGTIARGDKDFSGLTGLTGVTTSTGRAVKQYDIGTNRIVINGSCALGLLSPAKVVYQGDTTHNNVNISIVGNLFLGGHKYGPLDAESYNFYEAFFIERFVYGATIYLQTDQSPWQNDGLGGTGQRSTWHCTGKLFAQRGAISICGSFTASTPSKCHLVNMRIMSMNNYIYSSNYRIKDCELVTTGSGAGDGSGNVSLVTSPVLWDNVGGAMASTSYLALSSGSPTTGEMVLRNVPELGARTIFQTGNSSTNVTARTYNGANGSNYTYDAPVGRYYTHHSDYEMYFNGVDIDDVAVPTKTYFIGKTGTQKTVTHTGLSTKQNFLLRTFVNANGVLTDTRYDKNQDGTDIITAYSASYGYAPVLSTQITLKGINIPTISRKMLPDLSITETNKTTVDAYTTIDTPRQFYDRASSYFYDNLGTFLNLLVTRSGTDIDAGFYNVTIDATAGSAFSISGNTITIKSSLFVGNITTTGTITLANGAIAVGSLTDVGGTDTTYQYSITNIVAGSRIQVYNVTTATEIYNAVVGGTSYSAYYTEGVEFTTGDTVRVRLTCQSGSSACRWFKQSTTAGSGWSVLAAQESLSDYPSLGVDGSTVIEYSLDGTNVQADVNDLDGESSKRRLVAWYYYAGTTEVGIRDFFEGIVLEDSANARINSALVDLTVDNVSSLQLRMMDTDFRLYRDDNASWIAYPSTGGYGIDTNSGRIYIDSANISALQSTVNDVLADTNELQTNQGNWLTATGFATPTDVADSQTAIVAEVNANETKIDTLTTNLAGKPTLAQIEGSTVLAKEATSTSIKAKTDLLSFTGTDIKATLDGEEVVTDIASRNASKATGFATPANVTDARDVITGAISALNDFDPTNDVVAHVTLVDTTTTNTDMRGTNGAITSLSGIATATNVSDAQTAIIDELASIKGAGWTTETLKDIRENVGVVDLSPISNQLDDIEATQASSEASILSAIDSVPTASENADTLLNKVL